MVVHRILRLLAAAAAAVVVNAQPSLDECVMMDCQGVLGPVVDKCNVTIPTEDDERWNPPPGQEGRERPPCPTGCQSALSLMYSSCDQCLPMYEETMTSIIWQGESQIAGQKIMTMVVERMGCVAAGAVHGPARLLTASVLALATASLVAAEWTIR